MIPINLGGLLVVADANLLVADGEDWSEVRSPARAKRRRKRGFPQRIRPRYKPDTTVYRTGNKLIMHPVVVDALRKDTRLWQK